MTDTNATTSAQKRVEERVFKRISQATARGEMWTPTKRNITPSELKAIHRLLAAGKVQQDVLGGGTEIVRWGFVVTDGPKKTQAEDPQVK